MGMPALKALKETTARIGKNPLLVQGGGGNTSLKIDDVLWVKASGCWMSDAEHQDIFSSVPLGAVQKKIDEGESDPTSSYVDPDARLRPSIETSLHALLPHTAVLHVHSVNTVAWAIQSSGQQILSEKLAKRHWAWVPYRRPGWPLTQAVRNVLHEQQGSGYDVLVLANHGLVVGADSLEQAEQHLLDVEKDLQLPERHVPVMALDTLHARANAAKLALPRHDLAHGLALDAVALAAADGFALFPDQVVFLGPAPCVVRQGELLNDKRAEFSARWQGIEPSYYLIEGEGVLVSEMANPGVEEMLLGLALVLLRLPPGATLARINEKDTFDLLNWDAEQFRQKMTFSS